MNDFIPQPREAECVSAALEPRTGVSVLYSVILFRGSSPDIRRVADKGWSHSYFKHYSKWQKYQFDKANWPSPGNSEYSDLTFVYEENSVSRRLPWDGSSETFSTTEPGGRREACGWGGKTSVQFSESQDSSSFYPKSWYLQMCFLETVKQWCQEKQWHQPQTPDKQPSGRPQGHRRRGHRRAQRKHHLFLLCPIRYADPETYWQNGC